MNKLEFEMQDEKIRKSIAEHIDNYLKVNNISNLEFAKYFSIDEKAVRKWRNAESYPSHKYLPTICDMLGVTLDELFGRTLKD